ncbi:cohesin domain-containing protein [Natrarchaeobius halalkaliphilus]|uniref:Cohesin domain-containing protein n=1 Tax=Natrarchaeobius halalkaliphilus TaxID=1679091 RepID=A0A3N6LSQ2_9EURY|nr:cohesin domain-containing protein [Natrarchaeobius halalkaliphilus]
MLVVVLCGLAFGAVVPAPVIAGDSVTIIYVEESEIDADPGETIALEVMVSDHGDYDANGLGELSFDLTYDTDVFTATEVEHRSMLAAGDSDAEVIGSATIDDETGAVTIEQEREPPGDGAVATEPAATVTLEVAEDAPPTTETIGLTDGSAILVTDYPQSVFERDATVHVDGGDEESDGSGGEHDDADEPEGVTLADDAAVEDGDGTDGAEEADGSSANNGDASDETDDSDGETAAPSSGDDSTSDDPIPGFAIPAAIVGITAAIVGLVVRNRP